MATKPITQVRDWLYNLVNQSDHAGSEDVSVPLAKAKWAIGVLNRIDARDSQNQKKRRAAKKKTARR